MSDSDEETENPGFCGICRNSTDTPISPASLWHSRLQQAASLLLWIWVGFAMLQSGSQEATDTNGALVG